MTFSDYIKTISRYAPNLPDRTKIFLSAMWIWTWIIFQFTKILNYGLYFILSMFPDSMIFSRKIPCVKTHQDSIHILQAKDDFGNFITNKLKLLINLKWDKEMCDDRGGIDLDDFAECINSPTMWIAYLLECEEALTVLESMKRFDFDMDAFKKLIKFIIIDFREKLVYKYTLSDLDECGNDEIMSEIKPMNKKFAEDVLFGEINFYEN